MPVQVKGRFEQAIRDTLIDGDAWADSQRKALALNCRRAPTFTMTAS